MTELLAQLGFGSFARNAYETGAEIDLRAFHRGMNSPIYVSAKPKLPCAE